MLNLRLQPHLTLPAKFESEATAWHPEIDFVALTDEVQRDWIWYKGQAFYVTAQHLPAAQWVVQAMSLTPAERDRRLSVMCQHHQDYAHSACKSFAPQPERNMGDCGHAEA